MDATTLNKSTDTQTYNITLEGMDRVLSPSLSSTKTALEVLVSATNVARNFKIYLVNKPLKLGGFLILNHSPIITLL
jgi:hypothetical protein